MSNGNVVELIIKKQAQARIDDDDYTMLQNGAELLEYVYPLINASAKNQAIYRQTESRLQDEWVDGKQRSAAYAEAHAKATKEFIEYERTEDLIEWIYHMANMTKRMSGDVNNRMKAQ